MLIYVIVGNDRRPFNRLLDEVVEITGDDDHIEVVVQNGHTPQFQRKNWSWSRFFDSKQHIKNLTQSNLVIAHAGAGTLIDCINHKKRPLLLPRLKQYDEHKNDHQLEIYHYALDKNLASPLSKDGILLNDNFEVTKSYNFNSIINYVINKF